MSKRTFDKIAAGLREAVDVATIIRERDEARAIVRDTLWMARRYADGRGTYATSDYNNAARKALAAGIVGAPQGDGEPIWASDMMGASYAGLSNDEHAAAVAYRERHMLTSEHDERRAALASARDEALEEAAKTCDVLAGQHRLVLLGAENETEFLSGKLTQDASLDCAAAIRAMKGKPAVLDAVAEEIGGGAK